MTGPGGRKEAATPSAVLPVQVLPRSPREEVAGMAGEALRIRLTAPPVENRANEALVRFLARSLGVPRRSVTILSGGTGRRKLVRVEGLTRADCISLLKTEGRS